MKFEFPKFKNIFPITIPFDVAPELATANIYVLGKKELTLIDAGPGIRGAMDFIKASFSDQGLNIDNVQRILITHGHMDHIGLTSAILKTIHHPVEVYMHAEDSWRVTPEFFKGKKWNAELDTLAGIVGLPKEEHELIKVKINRYYSIAEPIENVLNMEDNDEFTGEGYHLRVIHAPGHSPGLCCFYETKNKVLFSGDHLLRHITPNPLISFDRKGLWDHRYKSLVEYKASLEKVSKLDIKYVFTGHGDYIEDMNEVLDQYKIHQRQRTDMVLQAVKGKETTMYRLVEEVFPGIEKGDLFLALSEIAAHLELLVDEGRAEIADEGPPVIYRAI